MSEKIEKGKSLLKNISLFFLASFVPKTISFFLVPLYTNCLTTREYGTIDLITATAQLLLPILTLQIQDAVLRFTLGNEAEAAQIYSAGLRIILRGCGILVIGMGIGCAGGVIPLDWTYILFFLVTFLSGALNNITTYFLRAIDQVRTITAASILNCMITVGANLLFLLVFRWGVNGYLLANALGHVFSLVLLFVMGGLHRYILWEKPDRALTGRIVAFSLPMVMSALAWWVNHSLDKYMLTFFCGVSASGLLAVANKIPTIIYTFGTIISKAFVVSVVQNFDQKDEDGFLGQSYGTISFLMVISASVLMVLNVPLSRFLFAKEFFEAWQIVPPLLLSAVMNHMSLSCEHICIALKRTDVISSTALIGAGVNIVFNLCLIPRMQGYGAALATAASFGIVWLIRCFWVRHHVTMKNNWIKEVLSYGMLTLQMICAYWGERFAPVQIILVLMICFLYRKQWLRGIAAVRKLRHG